MAPKTSKPAKPLRFVADMRYKLRKRHSLVPDKLTQRNSGPPFRLLDLPSELRVLILKELLYDDVPIFYGPKPDHMRTKDWERIVPPNEPCCRTLYPEILRVCKQLHDEGDPLLYSNTVRCVIDYDVDQPLYTVPTMISPRYPQQASYERFSIDAYPTALRTRLRRVHCDISFKQEVFKGTLSSNPALLTHVTKLAEFLEEHKNFQHLSFRLGIPSTKFIGTRQDNSYEVVRRQLLQPFTYLRGRSSIVADGVHEHLKARLQLVTTNQPVLHMHRIFRGMFTGVREIVESISYRRLQDLNYGKPIADLVRECGRATNEGLENEFLAARQKLLYLITMLQLLSNHDMFGVDDEQLPEKNRGPFLLPGPGLVDVRATFDGAGGPNIDNVIRSYEAAFGVTP